jgi:hypothetical protein
MNSVAMETDLSEIKVWRRVAIGSGLVACIVYPVLISVRLPSRQLTVLLGASFGPALAFACMGLGKVLQVRRKSVVTEIAVVSNALAGALVTAMIIVQLAVNYSKVPSPDQALTDFVVKRIWDVILGLDVSFDVFIGIGTALFGWSMVRDPRFGRIIGWAGIVIGVVVLLGFNFYTFPVPPVEAGLFDPGPLTGLWYLVVVLFMIIRVSPNVADLTREI